MRRFLPNQAIGGGPDVRGGAIGCCRRGRRRRGGIGKLPVAGANLWHTSPLRYRRGDFVFIEFSQGHIGTRRNGHPFQAQNSAVAIIPNWNS